MDSRQTIMRVFGEGLGDCGMRCGRSMRFLVVLFLLLLPSGCGYPLQQIRGTTEGIPVRFRYEDTRAKAVSIVADFALWKPQPMVKNEKTWIFEISLPPGRYLYGFLVDGQTWQPDPGAMLFDDDGFGKKNSVLVVE